MFLLSVKKMSIIQLISWVSKGGGALNRVRLLLHVYKGHSVARPNRRSTLQRLQQLRPVRATPTRTGIPARSSGIAACVRNIVVAAGDVT